MLVRNHRKKAHAARPWLGALAAAALLLLAFAAPMAAAPTKTQLSGAVVSPRTGTTATTVRFTVVYESASGARAERVTAVVGGVDHEMTRKRRRLEGVTFTWSGTLGVGTHAVVFTALAKEKSSASLPAGSVAIAAIPKPTPVPTPTPRPTPRPTTPRPTPPAPASRPRADAATRPGTNAQGPRRTAAAPTPGGKTVLDRAPRSPPDPRRRPGPPTRPPRHPSRSSPS